LSNDTAERWLLVSGGSGGIGAATCAAFAERGYRPVVGYCRNEAAACEIAAMHGGTPLRLDLSDAASIEEAAGKLEALPRLYGVVLAGAPPLRLDSFSKITPEDMADQWQVGVLGPQRLLAELLRRCFRRHKSGVVVGVLSAAMGGEGAPATPGMGAYVIAKYGLAGVLAQLAADHAWLRVRSVKPGYTETRMLDAFDARFLELARAKAPFQTPDQVASQIVQEALDT
jgi:NAD(P)-dependent dehydrogenase (short-subunit alcohol dehydrogenase family)